MRYNPNPRYTLSLSKGAPWLTGSLLVGLHNDRYDTIERQQATTNPHGIGLTVHITDWVQDAAREQARRKVRRRQAAGIYERGTPDWRYRLWASYDAAQGWVVVTLVGTAIGLNAAILSIVTEWLSDIKMGYCTTGFYLNESFCCWGEDSGRLYTTLLSCVPNAWAD
jgi:hypothetical protein